MPPSANNNKKPTKTKKKVVKSASKSKPVLSTNTKEIKAVIKLDDQLNLQSGFGDFLLEFDKFIAKAYSDGFTDKEVMDMFKVDAAYISKLKDNPNFVKLHNQNVMSGGIAQKTARVSKYKRALNTLSDEFFKRVEEGELEKHQITTIFRMMNESADKLEKLLGEGQTSEQNINILIQGVIKERTNKDITDFNTYNPNDDFPVIDVSAETI